MSKETAELIAVLRARCAGRIPFVIQDDNIRTLLDHITALEAALEPFAEACSKHFNDWCPDETAAWYVDDEDGEPGWEKPASVTVGDFRRAREACARSPISGGGT